MAVTLVTMPRTQSKPTNVQDLAAALFRVVWHHERNCRHCASLPCVECDECRQEIEGEFVELIRMVNRR